MYVPKPFRESRPEILHAAMRDIGAATIVGHGANGLTATHVPIELDLTTGAHGAIRFHFARANPHARVIKDGDELLLIFQGPEGYVTPSWYPSKQRTAKVVPTLNYIAIHAYGTVSTFADANSLRAHLSALTDHFEAGEDHPWKIDDAPAAYINGLCRAVIGFEVRLSRIEGKWKMSQNKNADDKAGVIDGLREKGDGQSLTMMDLVQSAAANG